MHYGPWLTYLNAYVEDTCVLVTLAFLLARGKVLNWITHPGVRTSDSVWLGILFGLIASSEVVLPYARLPYLTSSVVGSLVAVFADNVGAVACFAVIALASLIQGTASGTWSFSTVVPLSTFACAYILVRAIRPLFVRRSLWYLHMFTVGALSQGITVMLLKSILPMTVTQRLSSSVANGFALALIALAIHDAEARSESERRKLDLERMGVLVRDAQLSALKARIRPHFLFNALTSIAALCRIAPAKAADAIVSLSHIMRRSIDVKPDATQPLRDELEHVRAYLDIEKHRLGERLTVQWEMDETGQHAMLPAFALQTLVENAVGHGIAASTKKGVLKIHVRVCGKRVLLAVRDTGPGFNVGSGFLARLSPEHGLAIVNAQLTVLFGPSSRVRVFSCVGKGTLTSFAVPVVK
jgi:sensor histidine kinase YesM